MRIRVNGSDRDVPAGTTAADAARLVGVEASERGVAVAVGGDVVPRGEWAATRLVDGDEIEVVRAAAGG
ncbi:MAG: sulfur carrier protein ThiS [Thermoleophilia bacterium]